MIFVLNHLLGHSCFDHDALDMLAVHIYCPSCYSQGATAVCTFALCMGLGQPVLFFSGECAGNVVPPRPRIDQSKPGIASRSVSPLPALCDPEFSVAAGAVFGWDPIFEPVEGQVAGQPAQVSCLPRRAQSFFDALLFRLVFVCPLVNHVLPPQTFGEMTMDQKAEISHRGRALRSLKAHLLTLA